MTLHESVAERYASVQKHDLKMDRDIRMQVGIQPLPFHGMDKQSSQVCDLFKMKKCQLGTRCCYRHIRGEKLIVCKHWLRGLCKKGDDCEFLHEYDTTKMPVCYFFSNFGRCENRECLYLHVDPENRVQNCPWYARGFCKHGRMCKRRHLRKIMCPDFLIGFCPAGNECEYEHPCFELPLGDGEKGVIKCHFCGEIGHKSNVCEKNPHRLPPEIVEAHMHMNNNGIHDPGRPPPRVGMPLSKNFLDKRPQMELDIDQERKESTIYTIPTMGDDSTPAKAVGRQQSANQHYVQTKQTSSRDLGYGDGEQFGINYVIRCHFCGEIGHKSNACSKKKRAIESGDYEPHAHHPKFAGVKPKIVPGIHGLRPKAEVTCFKCLQMGHYANECTIPKGQAGPGYNNYAANKVGRGGDRLIETPLTEEEANALTQKYHPHINHEKQILKPWGEV